VYSVKEIIESMGVNYDTVKKWTEKEESYDDMFQICRSLCASHAEIDGLTFKISADKAFEHMFECNDEFIALYPTPEAQQALIESVRKEK